MIPQSSGANPARFSDFFAVSGLPALRVAVRLLALIFGLAFTAHSFASNPPWSSFGWGRVGNCQADPAWNPNNRRVVAMSSTELA